MMNDYTLILFKNYLEKRQRSIRKTMRRNKFLNHHQLNFLMEENIEITKLLKLLKGEADNEKEN